MRKNDGIHGKLKIFRILISVMALCMVLGMLILFLFKMEETVYAKGELAGFNDYELRSMVASSIVRICKDEGDTVKKGEEIIKLDSKALQDKIVLLKNEIAELDAEISVKKNSFSILKNDPLPKEYRYVETDLDECRKKFEKSEQKLPIYKKLYDKTVISRTEFEKIELEHIHNNAALKKAEEDYAKVGQGLKEKIILQAQNELKLLEVKLENKKKQLELTDKYLSDYSVIAPESGIVTHIPFRPGRYVEKGDVIAQMSTVRQKKYIAYVNERQVYKIHPGQKARITSSLYNHFNFGFFGGKVIQVSELPVKKDGTQYYPVEILVTEEPYNLKLGSSAEVMIITGRDRIIVCLLGLNQ